MVGHSYYFTLLCWTFNGILRKYCTGPYDAIHVGAAASTLHQSLIDQLNSPGRSVAAIYSFYSFLKMAIDLSERAPRMFIPIDGGFSQYIWQVDKDEDGNVTKEKQYGVLYVPLTDERQYKDEL